MRASCDPVLRAYIGLFKRRLIKIHRLCNRSFAYCICVLVVCANSNILDRAVADSFAIEISIGQMIIDTIIKVCHQFCC